MTLQPMQKLYPEITPSLGPTTTQGLLHSTDDMVYKCRSIFFVKKGKSLGWSYRYVTEVSARSDESMYPETVTLQNASSSTERTVEETTLATRSTRAARSSGERPTASSHRLIQKSCSRCKNLVFPQNEAWRSSTLQQMTSPITNGFPVKKVPMKDLSMESMLE